MIQTGKTTAGSTNWTAYQPNAITVYVDTSAANFTSVPNYVTSLGGTERHWEVLGATSIYEPSRTGFRIFIRFANGAPLTPAEANSWDWHVVWIGIE